MFIRRYLVPVAVVILVFGMMAARTRNNNAAENNTGEGMVRIFNVSKGEYEEVAKIVRSEEEWRKALTEEQFNVTCMLATERPFSGKLLKNKEDGIYKCIACGTDLFSSDAKYDSETGWPSFLKPVAAENVGIREDNSLFMQRIEVYCPRCGAHLGHVFDDGPPPTHKRFCINSAALRFQPAQKKE